MFLNRRVCLDYASGLISVCALSVCALLTIGFDPGPSQPAMGAAAVTHAPQAQAASPFVPPRRGLPNRREGGGSR
jgi:hypothetical protein